MSTNYHSIQQVPPPAYDSITSEDIQPANESSGSYQNTDRHLPDDFKYGVNVAESDVEIRQAFVRKVYGILTMQLLGTTAISALCMFNETVKTWVQSSPWVLLGSSLGTFVVLLALLYYRESHPKNMYLLGLFTVMESYTIGTIVSFYDAAIVLQALLISLGVFIGLTAFTMQTKYDFSGIGPFLYASIWGIVIASIVQIFLPFSRWLDLGIAIFSVLVFSGYIIYDTQQIMKHLSCDEYIVAAVDLYLDFINLFLNILRILNELNRD
ncbi:inhibitor of apoptosis-promoting Bax1-domain-containing protein [Syncephalis plumigaleata]|nr:inhibitor of apoptosis-promoting Bax1-domain-containing protein [Syncephalis plumigaleata]